MPYSKSKLKLESNLAKFCQLIASLSVALPQLNLIKFKLEYLKFGFKRKERKIMLIDFELKISSALQSASELSKMSFYETFQNLYAVRLFS